MGNCLGDSKDEPTKQSLTNNRQQNNPADSKEEIKSEEYELENLLEVNIIQCRNLPAYDRNNKSDPYVSIILGNEKYKTKKIKKELNPIYNDRIVKKGTNLLKTINNKIIFEIHEHDLLTKDDYIGKCIIDLTKIAKNGNSFKSDVMWLDIELNDKSKADKDNIAQIQIQYTYTKDCYELDIKDWNEVIEITVNKGEGFKKMDFIGRGDPYVVVQYEQMSFNTKVNQDNTWNQTQYIFVDRVKQKDARIRFKVMDKDLRKDDKVGGGFLKIKDITKNSDTLNIQLYACEVELDRELRIIDDEQKKGDEAGTLNVSYKVRSRKEIEKGFYSSLVDSFDIDKNGSLELDEVKTMLITLGINEDPVKFMDKFDTNFDQSLDKNEIMKFLSDADILDSDTAPKFVLDYLKKEDPSYSRHLMEGVLEMQGDPRTPTVLLKDRRTGLLVIEHTPSYVMVSYKLMYNSKAGRSISASKPLQGVIKAMSRFAGKKMDNPKSKSNIDGFIKEHLLDMSIVKKDKSEFNTFNDFFARALKEDARPIAKSDLVSIADCRLSVFNSVVDATKIWVKGKNFSIKNLLGPRGDALADTFSGGPFVIFRLAPQDYHRWHYGIDAKVTNLTQIDGDLFAVNPIAVNKDIDIYTSSKRCVIEMESNKIGKICCVAIGAALVGSYNIFDGNNENKLDYNNPSNNNFPISVKKGEVGGEFRFGGSTCLLLFEPNKLKFDDDLLENTKNKTETIVEMGMSLGNIIANNDDVKNDQ